MPRTRVAVTLGDLEFLTQAITPETTAKHPSLANPHEQLQEVLEEARQLMAERDSYTALKQEATRKLQRKLEEGRRLGTILRADLRFRHLHSPESLAAYGLKPAQGRPRGRKTARRATEGEGGAP